MLQSDEAVVLTAQEEFVDALPDGKLLPSWSHDQLPSMCTYMYSTCTVIVYYVESQNILIKDGVLVSGSMQWYYLHTCKLC